MSKEDFFNTLTYDQVEYCQFLIDTAYSNGYDQGVIDSRQY